MGKFYGKIGYAISTEKMEDGEPTSVWIDSIVERDYYGDVIRRSSKWQNSGHLNDNLVMSIQISIVADAFAYNNFSSIKYVEYGNTKWKVTDVDPQRPRLLLTLGGVWNGEES